MRYRTRFWLPLALALVSFPLSGVAQVEQPAVVGGKINYLDRSTGDITVDDYGARLIGQTRVARGNMTLSQAQLHLGQQVMIELFLPYPKDRPREVKTITIVEDGR